MMKTFWLLMLTKILNFPPRVSGRVAGLGALRPRNDVKTSVRHYAQMVT